MFHLDEATLGDYLCRIGLATRGERLSVEPAGDGNINWVRRVRRDRGSPSSWIVKQARPALERFPEYQVTTQRIVFEERWYEQVRTLDRLGVCPRIHAFEEAARVLVLEDLGEVPRLDDALARGEDVDDALSRLGSFLGAVHAATRDPALAERFRNTEMQTLHGDHIFLLPLRPNDFPLDPVVAERARRLQQDRELIAIADAAYARYREPRGALVHGDVQAGNVLLSKAGPKLLDAEIAHFGDPAFDLGLLLAHASFPAVAARRTEDAHPRLRLIRSAYRDGHGPAGRPDFAAAIRYAGLELLRRTIGAARVPFVSSPETSLAALDQAERWIRHALIEPPGD